MLLVGDHRDFRIRRHPGISRGDAGQSRCIRPTRCAAPNIAAGSNSARPCSAISPGSIRRPMKPRSRPRRRSSRRALRGLRRASRLRRGSTARSFSLVDAVFGPVFRYFDVFDEIGEFGILASKPKLARWRSIAVRRGPRCRSAVSAEYPALLRDFLKRRNSWLSQLAGARGAPIAALFRVQPAILASAATVFMLRAVPALAAGMTSLDSPMPSP